MSRRTIALLWVSLCILARDALTHAVTFDIALHPSFKLEYFRERSWEPEWIATAEEMLRDEFARSYADMDVSDESVGVVELTDDARSKVCSRFSANFVIFTCL